MITSHLSQRLLFKKEEEEEEKHNNKRWWWCGKKGTLVYSYGSVNWYSHYGKYYGGSSKIKHRITIQSSNSTPGYLSEKNIQIWNDVCTTMFMKHYLQHSRQESNVNAHQQTKG